MHTFQLFTRIWVSSCHSSPRCRQSGRCLRAQFPALGEAICHTPRAALHLLAGIPRGKALPSLDPGHFSGLCLQWATLRDEIISSPKQKNRLVTTHYRSGEFPRLKFLSFHGSPLYGQASPIMGCIYPNRTWGHGSQHEANTKLWLQLLPWVMKYSVSNPRVSCLLLASLKQ